MDAKDKAENAEYFPGKPRFYRRKLGQIWRTNPLKTAFHGLFSASLSAIYQS